MYLELVTLEIFLEEGAGLELERGLEILEMEILEGITPVITRLLIRMPQSQFLKIGKWHCLKSYRKVIPLSQSRPSRLLLNPMSLLKN